jgi:hypothetical protein
LNLSAHIRGATLLYYKWDAKSGAEAEQLTA